ncbi:MAG: fibrobacter succinogenes major paralogous domain-containing protein [Rikenellaceae bacterium]|nr:fibrobacter succinogenes major paralogous domain-containing protein [Rikenellaceae bacterium]MDE7356261.1 fibrobacter succinogenes major paralogous domain-containing protein [Rikenellaceae bacterium]
MEFPAVGRRDNDSDGSLQYAGQNCYYWSSVTYSSNSNYAYGLYFLSSGVTPQDYWNKRYGLSVRCVR